MKKHKETKMEMRQRHDTEPNHPDDSAAAGCLIFIAAIITAVVFYIENTRVFP
jgi:hypothetical protein